MLDCSVGLLLPTSYTKPAGSCRCFEQKKKVLLSNHDEWTGAFLGHQFTTFTHSHTDVEAYVQGADMLIRSDTEFLSQSAQI